MSNNIYIGKERASFNGKKVSGDFVTIENEGFYKISNVDEMRPFFMSIVSNSNHWMFISSNGSLTAGRKNSDYALFPYYTDDKITESSEITGSKTIIQVKVKTKIFLWEPFSNKYEGVYKITRNLYKNSYGNKVIFEEINHSLNIGFKYEWNSSNKYGFIKKSTLVNNSSENLEVKVLDGIQNIIPYGVGEYIQNSSSNLVDAYKKCELESDAGLGIYALSAIIVDKAEPSEALKANIAWSLGVKNPTHLLSSLQLDEFRKGNTVNQEIDIRAEKGAYLTCSEFTLTTNSEESWLLIANVNQSISAINQIKKEILNNKELKLDIFCDIEKGTEKLVELTGAADGLQLTADKLYNTRHFANTLFNIMRGGIFDNNYTVEKSDFVKYIENANKNVFSNNKKILDSLPEEFTLSYLRDLIKGKEDKDFIRLSIEYLPLKFSRRHGDPSRPWNKFSINTRNELDGSKILDYEGNWRDIFQNWEALAHSYPEFMEGMIHKFLNATTFDGYNPYRVTKGGFDWETIEPEDPWSYIGYWGDHQIIYLLKFLEFIDKHYPNTLEKYLTDELFVYANVPYKIKSYEATLRNPKDTIDFDLESDTKIRQNRDVLGADGALLVDKNQSIYKVNLVEKLLATVLAKVSNFIPEAGIWMNTQRPEWNDANNALVGNGVSMVTLYYLRRFLDFFQTSLEETELDTVEISKELSTFFNKVYSTLNENKSLISGKITNKDRKRILDGVGHAGSDYRTTIYSNGFSSEKGEITKEDLLSFTQVTLNFIDHSIEANKREDNLYHAYNLMTVENDSEVSISYLSEMLEGQVAVLSSGYLTSKESLNILNALKNSALFREDQYSYILYPNKTLARFSDKNNISTSDVEKSELLQQLVKNNNAQIIEKDCNGNYHFNGNFNNANSLKEALANLPQQEYSSLIKNDEKLVLRIFEKTFNHKAFTGRSGTFYGYEGLGSIYWHMVSKLLLAVQEVCVKAINDNEDEAVIGGLLDHYYEINEGIGAHKSPELYGAFPTDPYSHTPGGKGAQQPGMTGQVKEDVLSRFGELGVFVKGGELQFNPRLLRQREYLSEPSVFNYSDVNNNSKEIHLDKNSLCFTYCKVPIVYKQSKKNTIEVFFTNGEVVRINALNLGTEISKKVFSRSGEVEKIEVNLK